MNTKINISLPEKQLRNTVSKPYYFFFHKQRKSFKNERYLNLSNFNNRNATTKTRFSSVNLAINTTKWYNLQEDKKLAKTAREMKQKITTFEGKH